MNNVLKKKDQICGWPRLVQDRRSVYVKTITHRTCRYLVSYNESGPPLLNEIPWNRW
jgi:hypothetical protein